MLNIYPTSKGRIIEAIDEVGPICRVRADEILEEKVTEE